MPFQKRLSIFLLAVFCFSGSVIAAPGVKVVYPDWFKESFYDLLDDLQLARESGKQGLAVFFSEKSCSYCKAMVERTLEDPGIEQRLRKNYDVVGLDVFSDAELVDTGGNSHWVKDFAIREKAQFTPTMIFYGGDGKPMLRLVGYQSPAKMRAVLGYLEGGHHTRMTLREYIRQGLSSQPEDVQADSIDLKRSSGNPMPVLVVFESPDCNKCRQFRDMLKAPVMQPYLKQMQLAFVGSNPRQRVVTPEGQSLTSQAWSQQLALLHSPSMVFFDEQGKEGLRVDFDILITTEGLPVASDDAQILDNIRARLEYMATRGYEEIPQFQRWRAGTKKRAAQANN